MPGLGEGGEPLAFPGQEQPAIGFRLHQPIPLQAADRRGDCRLRHAHAARHVDGARLALLAQQVGDQFDVVLRGCRAVGLPLACEAGRVIVCWR
jgi:hypothetical protein